MAEIDERDEYTDELCKKNKVQSDIIYDLVMVLAGIREDLDPVLSGKIKRGRSLAGCPNGVLEPGYRKTRLADAKKIAEKISQKIFQATQENKINPLLVMKQ